MKNKKNNDNKSILFTIGAVLTLIVAIAGSTYAFFAVSAENTNTIKGGSAYDPNTLKLAVRQLVGGNGEMMPHIDSDIQNAITGVNGIGCKDEYGNTVCKVYEISITNTSTLKLNVDGTLTLEADKDAQNQDLIPNLKWAKGTSATEGFPTPTGAYYTKSDTALADITLNPSGQDGNSKTFYIVIWVSETGSAQSDNGEFSGTVRFEAYVEGNDNTSIGGITSTIRG